MFFRLAVGKADSSPSIVPESAGTWDEPSGRWILADRGSQSFPIRGKLTLAAVPMPVARAEEAPGRVSEAQPVLQWEWPLEARFGTATVSGTALQQHLPGNRWFWPATQARPLARGRAADPLPGAAQQDLHWQLRPSYPMGHRFAWTGLVRRDPGALRGAARAGMESQFRREAGWLEPEPAAGTRLAPCVAFHGVLQPANRHWLRLTTARERAETGWPAEQKAEWNGGTLAAPAWPHWAAVRRRLPGDLKFLREFLPEICRKEVQAGSEYPVRLRLPQLVCRLPGTAVPSKAGGGGSSGPLFLSARI